MSFISRNVSVVLETLVYRGREGQGAYLLHRVTGLGVLLFLALHILDIFVVSFGPEVYNRLLFIYKGQLPRLMEVALAFALTYHALNGLRIIVQDFYPRIMRHSKTLFWIQYIVFTLVFIPAATFMMREFNVQIGDFTLIGGVPYGLLVGLLLWAVVPASFLVQNIAPPQAGLNVSIAGGGK